jgi:uncharacterized protein YjbJ (UPF0337 family)
MNRDVLSGKWKQLRGEIRSRWGRITDDELDELGGDFEKLGGLLQERYGLAREDAKRQLDELSETFEEEPVGAGRP